MYLCAYNTVQLTLLSRKVNIKVLKAPCGGDLLYLKAKFYDGCTCTNMNTDARCVSTQTEKCNKNALRMFYEEGN